MIAIREKRGIQWNRSQISVSVGPQYSFFFYSCGVILWPEEYYSDEMPKCLTGRNV
jgi:hypothetical protein